LTACWPPQTRSGASAQRKFRTISVNQLDVVELKMEGLMAQVTLSIAGQSPHGHHYRLTPREDCWKSQRFARRAKT